ncbi:hypothetical protein Dimus_015982 [Dionaea muscipula]
MVDRRSGSVVRRETTVCSDDSVSPKARGELLFRQSPSPAPPRSRRAPPSPWFRGRGHQRSPSPMRLDSPDPEDFSSSEDEIATVATVSTSEGEELQDSEGDRPAHPHGLELSPIGEIDESILGDKSASSSMEVLDGRVISSRSLDLSPISEPDGVPEASVSPGSGSPPLSPTAAVRLCQASMSVREADVVSSSDSLAVNGGVFSGLSAGVGGISVNDVAVIGDGVKVTVADSISTQVSNAGTAVGGGTLTGFVQTLEYANPRVASSMGAGIDVKVQKVYVQDSRFAKMPLAGVVSQSPSIFTSKSVDAVLSSGLCGGGMVSEEARVLPGARGAMRPQPTDGLRQPSSAPVEPVSGVESRASRDMPTTCSTEVPNEKPVPFAFRLPCTNGCSLNIHQLCVGL